MTKHEVLSRVVNSVGEAGTVELPPKRRSRKLKILVTLVLVYFLLSGCGWIAYVTYRYVRYLVSSRGDLQIIVVGENSNPISGITVKIATSVDRPILREFHRNCSTDDQGRCFFAKVPVDAALTGKYDILVQGVNGVEERVVKIAADQRTSITVRLHKAQYRARFTIH